VSGWLEINTEFAEDTESTELRTGLTRFTGFTFSDAEEFVVVSGWFLEIGEVGGSSEIGGMGAMGGIGRIEPRGRIGGWRAQRGFESTEGSEGNEEI
jgi:hypothetical protein